MRKLRDVCNFSLEVFGIALELAHLVTGYPVALLESFAVHMVDWLDVAHELV